MDNFDDNGYQLFKINKRSTIKDYFDGLIFFEERYLNNIRALTLDIIFAALTGLVSCFFVYLFTDVLRFPLNAVIAYLFFLTACAMLIIIIRSIRLTGSEKKHYEYSVKNLIDRLIEDGVTINKNELRTQIGLKDACKKYKKEFFGAIALSAAFLQFFVFNLSSFL